VSGLVVSSLEDINPTFPSLTNRSSEKATVASMVQNSALRPIMYSMLIEALIESITYAF
jgi:hypothetical protein